MYVDTQKVTHRCVVIYDRDLQWRQFLARELTALGFEDVVQANTPQEALRAIRDHGADALVTLHDLKLVKFLRTNRASPNREIIIILVTANLGAMDVLQERDAGVNEIVAKPASAGQVITHLYNALAAPRDFVDAKAYHGPDRRRHNREWDKEERRHDGQDAVSGSE